MGPDDHVARIVVCDGDEPILDLLSEHLTSDNFEVLASTTASGALRFCRYNRPDLLVLDISPPDMPGVDVIKRIREADGTEPDLPILVLTDRAHGRLPGMDAGADDFLAKPFSYEELKNRISAALRRRHNRVARPIRVGELCIDEARRKVTVGDREVPQLSRREFTLLLVLASDPNGVFSKEELLWKVWGRGAPAGRTRTVATHISRLRSKLDPEEKKYIRTSWSVGYSLLGEGTDAVVGRNSEMGGTHER